MSITKTLGGDRLGSGKKMQVELHNYGRSTHNLGYVWRSTMSAGTLVPFMVEVALPGDTFDIDLEVDIKTHPTIGPLFGSYKVQLDVFQAPIRLYNATLHNNQLDVGMNMAAIKLPVLELEARYFDPETHPDLDNSQINPSCLLAYLGIRGVGLVAQEEDGPQVRQFNAVPFLAYWEIFKNYYANKQEGDAYYIHGSTTPFLLDVSSVAADGTSLPEMPTMNAFGTEVRGKAIEVVFNAPPTEDALDNVTIILNAYLGQLPMTLREMAASWAIDNAKLTVYVKNDRSYEAMAYENTPQNIIKMVPPKLEPFALSNIDAMRGIILSTLSSNQPVIVNDNTFAPYNTSTTWQNDINPMLYAQEGLAVKTYQSDLFNNWLNREWIEGVDGITALTSIDTTGGSFTIDTLNLSKKVYDMLNRIAVSGGSYDDWIDAVYAHEKYRRAESPIYHGGLIRELVFQQIESTAATDDGQPLGTLAGKGVLAQKRKGGKVVINVDEPSYLMGIVSLTPRIDYSQGNRWDVHLQTLDDLHKPALDEIGFQHLIVEQFAWWSSWWNQDQGHEHWEQLAAGMQPAWINYMTNYNRTYGNFAIPNSEMFMTLNRRYEYAGLADVRDLTTYIDPAKFNFIFADASIDAQNFWVQIAVDMTARRKMSARVIPNL